MRSYLLAVFCALLVTGCATTTSFQNTWKNTRYAQPQFSSFMVLAEHQSEAERRLWEDALVKAISASGYQATAGYAHVADDLATRDDMFDAVHETGVDAIILTRLHAPETRTQFTTQPMWSGWYGSPYYGWYGAAPTAYQYQVAMMEVSVFDMATRELVWTASTEIEAPFSTKNDRLAETIVKAFQPEGLLRSTSNQNVR